MSRSTPGGQHRPHLSAPLLAQLWRGVPQLLLWAALLASALPAQAATDAASVRQAVKQFLVGHRDNLLARNPEITRVELAVAGLDPRLNLPDCAQPLVVSAQEQRQLQARLNTQVSCTSGNGWSLYVPVDVSIYRPVVMTVRPLARGEVLTDADLVSNEFDVTRLNGAYLTDLTEAVGQEVKRPLAAQAVVNQSTLQAPLLIRRGEAVSIRAGGSALAVHMNGVAMTDGRLGQSIRVRNSSSNRIVDAKVTGPGATEVRM